jgi:hypothetical protein
MTGLGRWSKFSIVTHKSPGVSPGLFLKVLTEKRSSKHRDIFEQ